MQNRWIWIGLAAFAPLYAASGCSGSESVDGEPAAAPAPVDDAGEEATGSGGEGGSGGAAGSGGAGGDAGTAGSGGAGGDPDAGGADAPADVAVDAPPVAVRFVAMGDTGEGNATQKQVGDAIAALCAQKGCDFVQLLGDNFYDNGVGSVTDAQWQSKFEIPYQNVNLPFWVVLGNHDNGGNGAGTDPARGDVQIAYAATSTKWKMPARVYSHAIGPVEFFALDTNAGMFGLQGAQKAQVAQMLSASQATWKIAFGHHPYLSNGPHGNAGSYEGLPFVPLVNGSGVKDLLDGSVCGKADVYISGHDHSKQWLKDTCAGTELIVSGGGAKTTEIKGNDPVHYQDDVEGFLYVVIQGNTFTGELYDATGALQYTRTLTH